MLNQTCTVSGSKFMRCRINLSYTPLHAARIVPSTMQITQPLLKKCPISLRPAKLKPTYEQIQIATPAHWSANGRSPIKVTAIKIVNTGASARIVVAILNGRCARAL